MSLPDTIPMHPVDQFYGVVVPQVQTYLVAAPRLELDEAVAKERIEALIRERFQRHAYDMPSTMGVITTLRRAPDLCAPVQLIDLSALETMDADAIDAAPGSRHWHLFIAQSPEITILMLVYDHIMSHGYTGRSFLYAALDSLRPDASAPPALDTAQQGRFEAYQAHITAQFLARAPWATHRRVRFPSAPLRALAQALDQPFTEATMLWLARSVQDTSARAWPLDASIFRMEPDGDRGAWIQAPIGNLGLRMDSWEILASGAYARGAGPMADDPEGLERFVRFYEGFPWKLPLALAMRWVLKRATSAGAPPERERMVLNNLGHTSYPFFRTMFFDPVNDCDRFGLVFVDGVQDEVELQFACPKVFLEHFDQPAFEAALAHNLEAMLEDPRLRRIEG
jgi:hypothetical protein